MTAKKLSRKMFRLSVAAGDSSGGSRSSAAASAHSGTESSPLPQKYVGREKEQGGIQMAGLHQMDKTLSVRGARIAYSIWEVGGGETSQDHIPIACKDSVAILIMFDLTSRCTLNSVLMNFEILWMQRNQVVSTSKEVESGKSICKGPECTPFLLKRDVQHKREQDLQVHHGKALQPALDSGAKPDNRRTHHRFLDFALESHLVNISDRKPDRSDSYPSVSMVDFEDQNLSVEIEVLGTSPEDMVQWSRRYGAILWSLVGDILLGSQISISLQKENSTSPSESPHSNWRLCWGFAADFLAVVFTQII
ncbi:hypothetical protein C3L33_10294, partial [Rhododendron williamsianum]